MKHNNDLLPIFQLKIFKHCACFHQFEWRYFYSDAFVQKYDQKIIMSSAKLTLAIYLDNNSRYRDVLKSVIPSGLFVEPESPKTPKQEPSPSLLAFQYTIFSVRFNKPLHLPLYSPLKYGLMLVRGFDTTITTFPQSYISIILTQRIAILFYEHRQFFFQRN